MIALTKFSPSLFPCRLLSAICEHEQSTDQQTESGARRTRRRGAKRAIEEAVCVEIQRKNNTIVDGDGDGDGGGFVFTCVSRLLFRQEVSKKFLKAADEKSIRLLKKSKRIKLPVFAQDSL